MNFGSQNVGAGWGPPPLPSGLLQYYDAVGRQGLDTTARMIGGAIGGATGLRGDGSSLMSALKGAAEEADPELKKRNQEYKALQQYAEAAFGVAKEITNPMGLDQLKGMVRAKETEEIRRERSDKLQLDQQKLKLDRSRMNQLGRYYQFLQDQAGQQDAQREAQRAAVARFAQAYAQGPPQPGHGRGMPSLELLEQYGGAGGALRYAISQVPQAVTPEIVDTLLRQGSGQTSAVPPVPMYVQFEEGRRVPIVFSPATGRYDIVQGAKTPGQAQEPRPLIDQKTGQPIPGVYWNPKTGNIMRTTKDGGTWFEADDERDPLGLGIRK